MKKLVCAYKKGALNNLSLRYSTTLEDHCSTAEHGPHRWSYNVYATASLFERELYVYTPTVRVDEQYITKVSPLPSHVVLAFPPNDEPWPIND